MSITTIVRNLVPPNIRKPVRRFLYRYIPAEQQLGKSYWQFRSFLNDAQWWGPERTAAWQLEKLKTIVDHAYEQVPGYNALYREAGVSPDDIQSLQDIRLLPLVDKETIRDNQDDFCARNYTRWRRSEVETSGTMGVPMRFYHSDSSDWIEDAFVHSSWERAGWRLGDSTASLGTRRGGSPSQPWFYDASRKRLQLLVCHLNSGNVQDYVEKILDTGALHLMGGPSPLVFFANHLIEAGLVDSLKLKSVFVRSERIDEWHKARLRKAFPGVRLFGWYGHSERAVFAPWCESSENYHVWPQYGFTEVLRPDGSEALPGQKGEIVGTAFWSYATPFIRYRTRDAALRGADACLECGRQHMILDRIEGRVSNVLIAADGASVFLPPSLSEQVLKNVRQVQFYQDTVGQAVVRIVPRARYSAADTAGIQQEVQQLLGHGLTVSVEPVEDIPFTPGGKVQNLVQRLSMETRGMSAFGTKSMILAD